MEMHRKDCLRDRKLKTTHHLVLHTHSQRTLIALRVIKDVEIYTENILEKFIVPLALKTLCGMCKVFN